MIEDVTCQCSSKTYHKIADVMVHSHGVDGDAKSEVSEALLAVIKYARMELVYNDDQLIAMFSLLLAKDKS